MSIELVVEYAWDPPDTSKTVLASVKSSCQKHGVDFTDIYEGPNGWPEYVLLGSRDAIREVLLETWSSDEESVEEMLEYGK